MSYNEMSDSDEEGGDHDAYLERMKREGKDRDDDDSDDSSGKFILGCSVIYHLSFIPCPVLIVLKKDASRF